MQGRTAGRPRTAEGEGTAESHQRSTGLVGTAEAALPGTRYDGTDQRHQEETTGHSDATGKGTS